MTPLDYALAYAARGWRVFPCAPAEKRPLTHHGVHDATTDAGIIAHWWSRTPNANVAIACGNGLGVLDVDPRHGGDETLGALVRANGPIAETPRVVTGRGDGGEHYYFAAPAGLASSVHPGLELRCSGLYVVAPPSIHPESGRAYVWDAAARYDEVPLAPMPAWLGAATGRRTTRQQAAPTGPAADSFVGVAFAAAGMLGSVLPNGATAAVCPWHDAHSDGRGRGRDSSCVILAPTRATPLGAWRCMHAHCAHHRTGDALRALPNDALRAAARSCPHLRSKAARLVAGER